MGLVACLGAAAVRPLGCRESGCQRGGRRSRTLGGLAWQRGVVFGLEADGGAGRSAGGGEGVAAVLELELPWQQAGEAEEAAGGEGRGWSFSCRSRSKLQQTSGKALPLWRDRDKGDK